MYENGRYQKSVSAGMHVIKRILVSGELLYSQDSIYILAGQIIYIPRSSASRDLNLRQPTCGQGVGWQSRMGLIYREVSA